MSVLRALLRFMQPWRKDYESAATPKPGKKHDAATSSVRSLEEIAQSQRNVLHRQAVAASGEEFKTSDPDPDDQTVGSDTTGKTPRGTRNTKDRGLYLVQVHKRPELDPKHLSEEYIPRKRHVFAYHDEKSHIVIAHLVKGSAFHYKDRSNAARAALKPKLYPLRTKYDRTHLIPFGYHGSENDPQLLVGWDSSQNQGEMNAYEKRIKALSGRKDLIWACEITKGAKTGATLAYYIYDPLTGKQAAPPLIMRMQAPFMWQSS